MYPAVLFLHSWVRWIVAIAAVVAVMRAFYGWLGKKHWAKLDDQLGLLFSTSLDVQMLLGLILYIFLSPITQAAFKNFSAAMSDSVTRFFTIEHIFYMVIAVVLGHVGRALSRKATEATAQHRMAAILFGLATLAILFAIPWPFTAAGAGRPWFRL
jgi:hypothetical protein